MKNLLIIAFIFLASVNSIAQDLKEINTSFSPRIEKVGVDFSKNVITTVPQINWEPVSIAETYYSSLGLGVDATFFNFSSDQVEVTQGTGWSASFESRGDYRDDFDLIYALGIFNHNFSVNENLTNDLIDMNMLGVEIKFLVAWKVAQSDYFSIEAGPAIQLNGELKVKEDRYEDSLIGGVDASSIKEFQTTSPFNLNGVVGFSTGVNNFRLTAHYHYSFLDALNGTTITGNSIDGNFSFLSVGARVYF